VQHHSFSNKRLINYNGHFSFVTFEFPSINLPPADKDVIISVLKLTTKSNLVFTARSPDPLKLVTPEVGGELYGILAVRELGSDRSEPIGRQRQQRSDVIGSRRGLSKKLRINRHEYESKYAQLKH
jgi:hypothetical protein